MMIILAVLGTAAAVYLDGFVLMRLWQWFAVEPFGLPAIPSWFVAKGLLLLACVPAIGSKVWRRQASGRLFKDLGADELAKQGRDFIWSYLLSQLVILGLGWLFKVLA